MPFDGDMGQKADYFMKLPHYQPTQWIQLILDASVGPSRMLRRNSNLKVSSSTHDEISLKWPSLFRLRITRSSMHICANFRISLLRSVKSKMQMSAKSEPSSFISWLRCRRIWKIRSATISSKIHDSSHPTFSRSRTLRRWLITWWILCSAPISVTQFSQRSFLSISSCRISWRHWWGHSGRWRTSHRRTSGREDLWRHSKVPHVASEKEHKAWEEQRNAQNSARLAERDVRASLTGAVRTERERRTRSGMSGRCWNSSRARCMRWRSTSKSRRQQCWGR